jgi:serine beta-lactamase-like protein LACTB, mitochondrial
MISLLIRSLLLLSLAASPLVGQVAAPARAAHRPAQADIARARKIITDTMRALGSPGASVAVMFDGQVIWSEGFGLADVEQQVPVTARTVFRIGSVSKPLTAAALGFLVQQGKVDLDAEIQRYVPSFPVKRFPITVRQVAGHVAGIRHYRDGEFANQKHYDSVLDGLAIFSGDSLMFEPGTQYQYSSYGWNLISAVIESASGESFLSFMRKTVFGPAGMEHTYPEFADSIIPFRADFYAYSDSSHLMLNAPYVDNSYKWAGGGFVSTSEDLVKFGQAMLTGRLLRPPTVATLWTPMTTRSGKPTNYGIGWGIVTDSAGRRRVGHTGGAMGGTATLQIYPEQRLIIAILVNSDRTFIGIAPRLARILLGSE